MNPRIQLIFGQPVVWGTFLRKEVKEIFEKPGSLETGAAEKHGASHRVALARAAR